MALNFLNNGYFAGKVGIGTESPNAKLEVNSAITFSTIDTFGQLVVKAASGSTGDMLNIGVDTANSVTFIQANDRGVGTIPLSLQRYGGYVGIGTISPTTPLSIESSGSDEFIKIENTATYTGLWMNDSGTNNGWLVLSGYTDAVSLGDFAIREYGVQTSLTIKQTTGNVGIGTTNPSAAKLVVDSSTAPQILVKNSSGNNAQILFEDNSGGTQNASIKFDQASQNTLTISTGYQSPNNTNRIYLAPAGDVVLTAIGGSGGSSAAKVGIGTTTPTAKLHVVGTGLFTGLVSGITPVNAANFVTKAYVDGSGGGTGPFLPLAGGTMTGTIIQNGGNIDFSDGRSANFGNGDDLQIYHDGSNSYIKDTGTGDLIINTNLLAIQNAGATESMAKFFEGGTVALYYDDSLKFATTSTGIAVTGDIQIDSALLSNQENTDVDTGTEAIASVAIATYTAAFFDFVIKKGTNVRSGTVYACHDGTSVAFTETSTQDLGDTSDVTLSVDISGGNMRLLATVTSDDWSVKSLIRAI